MSSSPQHRYDAVICALKVGRAAFDDALMQALFELLSERPCPSPEVAYAYDLYGVDDHRVVVDAFLLSKAPLPLSAKAVEIPVPVLETYRHLFMDTTVFRNKLEAMTFATNYDSSPYGKELVKAGVSVGPEYLLWAYGATDEEVDTRYVIRRTMLDSFFRGMAHKGNSLTSNIAKESQKWWSTAIRNAEILERIDPRTTKAAYEELRIALEGRDETVKTEQSPVPVEDILH